MRVRKINPDVVARQIVIRSSADAEQLARSDIPFALFGVPAIALNLPFPPSLLLKFQTEADRLTTTCGCVPSAIVMLLVLAPAVIGTWTMDVLASTHANRWLLTVGAVVISAMVGLTVKYAVIAEARRRLRRLLLAIASSGCSTSGG